MPAGKYSLTTAEDSSAVEDSPPPLIGTKKMTQEQIDSLNQAAEQIKAQHASELAAAKNEARLAALAEIEPQLTQARNEAHNDAVAAFRARFGL